MSNYVRPHRRQPTRLPCPWDFPGKNTGVGCHFPLQCMKVESESEVAQSCPTLATPWTAAHQAPPSMGFSRQKYWSRVPLPSPITEVTRLMNPWCHREYILISERNLRKCLRIKQRNIVYTATQWNEFEAHFNNFIWNVWIFDLI